MNISLPFVLTLWHFIPLYALIFYVVVVICSLYASMWLFISFIFSVLNIYIFFLMLPMIMLLLNIIVNWAGRHFSVVQKYYLVHDQIFNTIFNYRLFSASRGCTTRVIEFMLFINQLNLVMLFNVVTLKAACRNVRYMIYKIQKRSTEDSTVINKRFK